MDEIRKLILELSDNDIDPVALRYFTNYFYVVSKRGVFPKELDIRDSIRNALKCKKIYFYDEKDPIYKELGPDVKGLRDTSNNILYVRDTLDDLLKEIVIYHEIHHAAQSNSKNNGSGINQNSNIGRMVMEAQTQYWSEEVYKEVHGVNFEQKEYPSEKLRMKSGGTIVSSLHNYQMYDTFLSKLAIILGVDKDYFVKINYYVEDNKGLDLLKDKYEDIKNEKKLSWTFDNLMYNLDYIYCVDLMTYKDNQEKQILLNGEETPVKYEIYPGKGDKLSLDREFGIIDAFDRSYLVDFLDQEMDEDIARFSTYVVNNEIRNLVNTTSTETKKTEDTK